MDHSIDPIESCRFLLSPSRSFEPYIPDSHQDVLDSLSLLGQLGHITRSHVKELISQKAEAQAQAVQAAKTAAPPEPPPPPVKPEDHLAQALMKLRNSETFKRRLYRGSSNIIRQQPWNPQSG